MDTLTQFARFLAELLGKSALGVGGRVLLGFVAIGWMWIFHAIITVMPDQAWRMFGNITDVFFTQPKEWSTFVAKWLTELTGTEITPEQIAGATLGEASGISAQKLGKIFLEPMLGLIMPDAETDWTWGGLPPEEGMRGAERFLSTNLTFQMQAWLLHLLGDTISFGMWKSLKDLPNAINWSYGLGWLSWMVMGVPFRMGISDPLERLYNEKYRPWRPSLSYMAKAFWREEITADQYRTALKYMGIPEEWIPIVIELEREPFSVAEIRNLYRIGYLTFDEVVWAFRDRNNSPADAEALATYLTNERLYDLLEDIADEAVKLYVDGIFSWTEVAGYLAQAGYTSEEIGATQILADLRRQRKTDKRATDKELTAANIGQLYRMGEYEFEEAYVALTTLPFKPEQINDFLKLYTPPEPKVEEPPSLTRAAIGTMWKRQQITDREAEDLWRGLGFDDETIYYWFKFYTPQIPWPPPPPAPPELTVSRIGTIYREGGMERGPALDRLEDLGWDREDAALILDYIYPPPAPEVEEERRLPRGTIGTLYREGIIGREDALSMWQELGYSRSTAETLAALYEPPPEVEPPVLPPRELSTSQVGQMYRRGAITLQDGIERLERIRWRAEDAELLLTTLYAPPEPEVEVVARLPRETIGGLYSRGIITEADARSMWTELGYDGPTVELLAAYYAPPPEVPPPVIPPAEFTTSQVGQLYREGGFTLSEAVERLERIGWRAPDAELLLTTLYAPPEPPVAEARMLSRGTIGSLYQQGIIDQDTARTLFQESGYSAEVVEWLLQLYAPPPEVPVPVVPPRELTTSQVGSLYRQGALSLEEAIERLIRINWRREDAELILTQLYAPPVPEEAEERLLTKSDIARLYSSALITEEAFRGMMQALAYSAENVELLEQLYRPITPAPEPPAELQPSTVGRLWQARTIDLQEAVRRLNLVNIPQDNALLFLTLYAWDPDLVEIGKALQAEEITTADAEALWFDLGMTFDNIQLWERLWL